MVAEAESVETTSKVARREAEDGRRAIDFDLACIACDYNLRTLTAEAGCPECGRPVADTLEAFSRGWEIADVATWRGACKVIGISGLLTAAVPIVLLVGSLLVANVGAFGPVVAMGLIAAMILAEHGLWVFGVLRISAGHPGTQQMSSASILRLRVAVILNGVFAVPAVLLPIAFGLMQAFSPIYVDEGLWSLWGGFVAGAVASRAWTVGELVRLMARTLGAAGRLWKRRHVIATGTAVILLCAAQGLSTLILVLSALTGREDWVEFAAVVGSGSILALPVVAIWAAVSVFRAGVAFKNPSM